MMTTEEYFEAHVALPSTQPSELCRWDCNPVGFPTSHDHHPGCSFSLSEPPPHGQCVAAPDGFELSDIVEQVVRQLSDVSPEAIDDAADFFSVENYVATAPPPPELCRPRKKSKGKHLGDDSAGDQGGEAQESDERAMRLLALLLECAVAISVDDLAEANRVLLELTHVASPYSPSCAERLVAYFAQAMASRVMNSWLGVCTPLQAQVAHNASLFGEFQVFSSIAPFVKFAHFTANQAIMEALHQRDPVHIVDLDVDAMQGLQWPALLHALATRTGGPPRVRMTALGATAETGRRLCDLARRLGVPFEFRAVAKRPGDVDPGVVRTQRGEAVAVHWMRQSLYDATGPDRGTMRLLEVVAPRVITLVEQEVVQAGTFLDRFAGSLHYYAAMFDALGAAVLREDPSRHRVESCLLAREVTNMLAVGGPARTGEEKFASWRAAFARHGRFAQVPMSSSAVAQAQLVLSMFPPSHGYTLHHGDGTLRLGWKGTCLYTASAWTSLGTR